MSGDPCHSNPLAIRLMVHIPLWTERRTYLVYTPPLLPTFEPILETFVQIQVADQRIAIHSDYLQNCRERIVTICEGAVPIFGRTHETCLSSLFFGGSETHILWDRVVLSPGFIPVVGEVVLADSWLHVVGKLVRLECRLTSAQECSAVPINIEATGVLHQTDRLLLPGSSQFESRAEGIGPALVVPQIPDLLPECRSLVQGTTRFTSRMSGRRGVSGRRDRQYPPPWQQCNWRRLEEHVRIMRWAMVGLACVMSLLTAAAAAYPNHGRSPLQYEPDAMDGKPRRIETKSWLELQRRNSMRATFANSPSWDLLSRGWTECSTCHNCVPALMSEAVPLDTVGTEDSWKKKRERKERNKNNYIINCCILCEFCTLSINLENVIGDGCECNDSPHARNKSTIGVGGDVTHLGR
jgi:hypothetical protein